MERKLATFNAIRYDNSKTGNPLVAVFTYDLPDKKVGYVSLSLLDLEQGQACVEQDFNLMLEGFDGAIRTITANVEAYGAGEFAIGEAPAIPKEWQRLDCEP